MIIVDWQYVVYVAGTSPATVVSSLYLVIIYCVSAYILRTNTGNLEDVVLLMPKLGTVSMHFLRILTDLRSW